MHSTPSTEITQLDWRGLKGPEPIVNTSKAVKRLGGRVGVLRILADDESFPADLKSWCRATRAELVRIDQEPNGAFAALVRLPAADSAAPGSQLAEPPLARDSRPVGPEVRSTAGMDRIDCRGMQCPEPILVLAKAVRELEADRELEVLANDQAFPMDVRSWCRSAGAELVSMTEDGGAYRAVIRARARRKEAASPARSLTETSAASMPAPAPAIATDTAASGELRVDLSGLPLEAGRALLDSLSNPALAGTLATILANHDGFAHELVTWCTRTGHVLQRLNTDAWPMVATVRLAQPGASSTASGTASGTTSMGLVPVASGLPATLAENHDQYTLLVLHNDLETLLAALMTANAAAASGMRVRLFFAFWGINVLRADRPRPNMPAEKVSFLQRMFKWMMPRGPRRQRLGKLSFGGMGGTIMRGIMKKQNMMLAEELLDQARQLGVRFVVCTMSMSVMGITTREIMDLPNIEFAGVTSFVSDARGAGLSLVF